MNRVMEVSTKCNSNLSSNSSFYSAGQTCTNNEDMNGTVYGSFRCPLNGFPLEAKACCGDYGKQFCCIPERPRSVIYIYIVDNKMDQQGLFSIFFRPRKRKKVENKPC